MTDAPTSRPLLTVSRLKTWFPIRRGVLARTTGYVRAVDDVSLHLEQGETLGLVGESGCGKTTLGRSVMGLETPREGEIHFGGVKLWGRSRREVMPVRRRLQMIFQDPYSSLNPRMTIIDVITEGPLEHGLLRPAQRRDAATALLREVGLDEAMLDRYPHEFSGGQRQRISIARALGLRPELIICDEAVSALDVSVRAQVLNLLMELKAKHNLAYLFISHDLGVIRHITQRVEVMYLGVIMESGPTAAVLTSPAHPYTRALISAVPIPYRDRASRIILRGDVPSAANPPPGCRFHTRCPYVIDACRRVVPPLESCGPAHRAACIRKHELPPFTAGI